MKWKVKWLPEAVKDMEELDRSIKLRVLKAIVKLEDNPLGYGEPLGEKAGFDLSGMHKLKTARGYRVVYRVEETAVIVLIVVVGKREDLQVYRTAAKRISAYRKKAEAELNRLADLLK
ncbi:type II toxin-antitoxin system RelE family toxin [Moorella sp. Hama-1]|uniref:type II toxin-antitoxin system RelE family toxin n=1 Tax=Moorella sp. Hama-1 TaxID=2138101 RepID=UPI000D6529FA|nr:type II toxin-antitoxin system RelE/ParE family toxin [Moorella sp. Hama-1]BCV22610.1 RelE toxin [Moorella sp. Hama-1]